MTMQAIRPIRNKKDYEDALREASFYFDHEPEPGSAEADRFEVLTLIIENDETRHFPIEAADPVEAIKFRMEQQGLTPKDLVPSIGKPNRVYEVLNRKRSLTMEMVRKLHKNLHIPLESLIGT
jgi:HTH-type transcriptional regulator/antitoxin HigA